MGKLSDKSHWDQVHAREADALPSNDVLVDGSFASSSLKAKLIGAIKKLLGSKNLELMNNYDEYRLWDVIFPGTLTGVAPDRVLEVGSAPGEFLVKFARKYNCEPFGVEYSETGVSVNREIFIQNGFPPGNVFHADFFDSTFQEQHRGSFDVVVSRGFIEHFDNVETVIERHLDLVKPGGYLIINIPNLHGVNHILTKVFNKDLIPLHNLEIMRLDRFSALFDDKLLERLFCDYYGTFSFYLFYTQVGSPLGPVLTLCHRLQPILNLIFRVTLGESGIDSRHFSPSLLYIGRKRLPPL